MNANLPPPPLYYWPSHWHDTDDESDWICSVLTIGQEIFWSGSLSRLFMINSYAKRSISWSQAWNRLPQLKPIFYGALLDHQDFFIRNGCEREKGESKFLAVTPFSCSQKMFSGNKWEGKKRLWAQTSTITCLGFHWAAAMFQHIFLVQTGTWLGTKEQRDTVPTPRALSPRSIQTQPKLWLQLWTVPKRTSLDRKRWQHTQMCIWVNSGDAFRQLNLEAQFFDK